MCAVPRGGVARGRSRGLRARRASSPGAGGADGGGLRHVGTRGGRGDRGGPGGAWGRRRGQRGGLQRCERGAEPRCERAHPPSAGGALAPAQGTARAGGERGAARRADAGRPGHPVRGTDARGTGFRLHRADAAERPDRRRRCGGGGGDHDGARGGRCCRRAHRAEPRAFAARSRGGRGSTPAGWEPVPLWRRGRCPGAGDERAARGVDRRGARDLLARDDLEHHRRPARPLRAVRPLPVSPAGLAFDLGCFAAFTLLAAVLIRTERRVSRVHGAAALGAYFAYLALVAWRG